MHFEGSVTVQASHDQVWKFLIDPHAVSQCAPGLESLEIIAPDKQFRATVSVGFGSLKVTFVTDVEWLELHPPKSAKMKMHGRAPGSAVDAVSEMILNGSGDGSTEIKWTADVDVHGKIASLAARLLSGVTQKLTGAFFECVKNRIEA